MNISTAQLSSTARTFFEKYGEDFDAAKWPAFAAHYCEPAFSVRADGSVTVLDTRASVGEFFSRVWSTWRQEGYVRFAFSNLSVTSIGNQSMLVTLTWHLLNEEGTEIRQWNQSYQLLSVSDSWRVLSSTFHRAPV